MVPHEDADRTATYYAHLEEWWGDELGAELIDRISLAPAEQLISFAGSVTMPRTTLPPTPSGFLRPALGDVETISGRVTEVSLALRLLMFTHEVVIEPDDFAAFGGINWPQATRQDRERLRQSLERLQQIRPLIVDGSIKVTSISSRGRHPSRTFLTEKLFTDPTMQGFNEELGRQLVEAGYDHDDVFSYLRLLFARINGSIGLAEDGTAHLLALTAPEQSAIEALLQQPILDKRHGLVTTLARLQVPVLDARNVETLVKVRQNETLFADWRQNLATALSYVDGLSEDGSSVEEASKIVSTELQAQMTDLRKATEKSPALEALKGGLTGLAINGMSATTTGLITGNPLVALAAGATGKVAEAAITYVKKAAERKKNRLIIDLAMSFDTTHL